MGVKTPVGVIFESLKGSWRLKRSLNSVLPGFPSGLFEGTATFTSRATGAHSFSGEFLYAEQGELKTESGLSLKANRKYIYRYNSDEDKISAWFVKEDTKQNDGQEEVDYLFHDLEMDQKEDGWIGQGEHLCNKDMYWAFYDFRSLSVVAKSHDMDVFGVRYKVKGPSKDYTSDTAYQRIFDADAHCHVLHEPIPLLGQALYTMQLRTRNDTGDFREMLFSYLDDGVSLLRLRCTSRVLENIIGHLPLDQLFRHVYIRTPLPEPEEMAFLVEIAPHVQSLTIVIGSADLSPARAPSTPSSQVSRRSQEFVQNLLHRLNQLGQSDEQIRRGSRNSMPSLRRSLLSMLPNANSPRASVPPASWSYAEQQQHYEERQLWFHILSQFGRLSSLTLRVHGDIGWPGLTEIEQTLINIRGAVEQPSFSAELRTLNLIPVHAMGIIHLLWTPLHAFGESSTTTTNIWQEIETLDLRIRSPTNLAESQQIMFKQLLYQYLDSFAPSLRRLRVIWLGSEGPSPLALHLEPGLVEERRPPIEWDSLEELWLGNITQPHQTIRLIPQLSPNVRMAKTLRSTRRDSLTLDACDSSAWMEVILAQTSPTRVMMDRSSSLYSRESARVSIPWPTGISRSSREVEFMLDVKNM